MPTYEYACRECGRHLEVVQSFTDEPLTVCPSCDGPLRKVFGSIGIAFKGSGFYKTDSRGGSSASSASSSSTSSEGSKSTETKSSDTSTGGSTPTASSTPAAAAS